MAPVLKRLGLYQMSQMTKLTIDSALLTGLIERWRPETHLSLAGGRDDGHFAGRQLSVGVADFGIGGHGGGVRGLHSADCRLAGFW